MKHRKLRIAWSVACSIVCVLLIALWVRSDDWYDSVVGRLPGGIYFQLASSPGTGWLQLSTTELAGRRWKLYSQSEDRFWHLPQGLVPAPHALTGEFGHKFNSRGGLSWTVGAPYWLATSVVAFAGSMPWLRYRFSLRTLLIAATVVAVGLGAIVILARQDSVLFQLDKVFG